MNSIFQLRVGENSYPVFRFLVHRARELDITRGDLARRLGYRDLGDAHKALADVLKTGAFPAHMRKHLADALELDQAVMDSVGVDRAPAPGRVASTAARQGKGAHGAFPAASAH